MPKEYYDRVEGQMKRLPGRGLPSFLRSNSLKMDRLSFLEAINREFKNDVKPHEKDSLQIVQDKIDKESRKSIFRRVFDAVLKFIGGDPENSIVRFTAPKKAAKEKERINSSSNTRPLFHKNKNIIKQVSRDLRNRGFFGELGKSAIADIFSRQKTFSNEGSLSYGKDSLKYKLHYERSQDTGRFYASQLDATLQKEVKIDRENINGVHIPSLEKRMSELNWKIDFFNKNSIASNDPEDNKQVIKKAGDVFSDLMMIMGGIEKDGRLVHDQLAYKYFSGTPNIKAVTDLPEMQERYEVKTRMNLSNASSQNFLPKEIYNLLDGRAVEGQKTGIDRASWYEVDRSQKDNLGFHQTKAIPDSDKMNLDAALLKAGVEYIKDAEGTRSPKDLLRQGELVMATLNHDGLLTSRMVSIHPQSNTIKIDAGESLRYGLINNTTEPGHEKIHAYHESLQNIKSGVSPNVVSNGNDTTVQNGIVKSSQSLDDQINEILNKRSEAATQNVSNQTVEKNTMDQGVSPVVKGDEISHGKGR